MIREALRCPKTALRRRPPPTGALRRSATPPNPASWDGTCGYQRARRRPSGRFPLLVILRSPTSGQPSAVRARGGDLVPGQIALSRGVLSRPGRPTGWRTSHQIGLEGGGATKILAPPGARGIPLTVWGTLRVQLSACDRGRRWTYRRPGPENWRSQSACFGGYGFVDTSRDGPRALGLRASTRDQIAAIGTRRTESRRPRGGSRKRHSATSPSRPGLPCLCKVRHRLTAQHFPDSSRPAASPSIAGVAAHAGGAEDAERRPRGRPSTAGFHQFAPCPRCGSSGRLCPIPAARPLTVASQECCK